MIKNLCCFLMIFCLIISGVINNKVLADIDEQEVIIYVSPYGSDSGNGSPNNMLKTPHGVQQFLKKSGLLKKQPVKVIFKKGDYYIDETILLGSEDAGSEDCPVTWEAEEKGGVRFLGTTILNNALFQPVTEQSVLARIPNSSKSKVLQLNLEDVGISIDPAQAHLWSNKTFSQPYTDLIVDGKKQMLARWPNGVNNYATWDSVVEPGVVGVGLRGEEYGARIVFNNPRLFRWYGVKNAYIAGHVSTTYSIDFAEIHSINPDDNTIKFMTAPQYTFSDSAPKDFQIFNLLEELDTPSEWYIDADSQMLYHYPNSEISRDTKIELVTLNENMLQLTQNSDLYYKFCGIEFSGCRQSLVVVSANHVTFDGCTFMYSKGREAVYVRGTNNKIVNCVIVHADGRAVLMGGEAELNKPIRKHSVFKNNYIYDVGEMVNTIGHAIIIDGCSCIDIVNNTVHYVPQGVTLTGATSSELRVIGNEFYNFGMNLSDVGGFYMGYSGGAIGTEVAYNYFYDYEPANKLIGRVVQGVYFDDGTCYGNAHHNIFENGSYGGIQIGGGKYNKAESNIFINMGTTPIVTDNRVETWETGEQMADTTHSQSKDKLEKFPRLAQLYPWTNNLQYNSKQAPIGNVIRNNISTSKIVIDQRIQELGKIQNNYKLSDLSHFVDPENGDYRIKDDSIFANLIPELTESNFDIQSIGCTDDVTQNIDTDFSLLFPYKDAKCNANTTFVWENSTMADEYKITIASDSEMRDVIFEKTVKYNWCDVDGLESGKQYWWTVEANNNSFKRNINTESEVWSFVNEESYHKILKNVDLSDYANGKFWVDVKDSSEYITSQYGRTDFVSGNGLEKMAVQWPLSFRDGQYRDGNPSYGSTYPEQKSIISGNTADGFKMTSKLTGVTYNMPRKTETVSEKEVIILNREGAAANWGGQGEMIREKTIYVSGKYDKLHFIVATAMRDSGTANIDATVTYTDGTTSAFKSANIPSSCNTAQAASDNFFADVWTAGSANNSTNMNNLYNANYTIKYILAMYEYSLDLDPDKTVKSIHFITDRTVDTPSIAIVAVTLEGNITDDISLNESFGILSHALEDGLVSAQVYATSSGKAILAIYDKDKTRLLASSSISLNQGNQAVILEAKGPEIFMDGDYKTAVMLWQDFETLKPIYPAIWFKPVKESEDE